MKNAAASALGRLRWAGVSAADRSAYMTAIAKLPRRASVLARQAADEAQAWSDSTAGRGLEPRVDAQAAAAARDFCRAYADRPANAVGRRSADEASRDQRLTVATAALLAVATGAGIDPGELAVVCGGTTAAAWHATAEAANAALWA